MSVYSHADQRLLLVEHLQGQLEQRVAREPTLLALDDLHWADPITLLALRSMTRDLASYPLVWVLSRTTGGGDCPRLNCLFDLLERDGATRITLEALDQEAVADVVADVLGAKPDPDVLALAGIVDGNPFLLVDLLEKSKGRASSRSPTVARGWRRPRRALRRSCRNAWKGCPRRPDICFSAPESSAGRSR